MIGDSPATSIETAIGNLYVELYRLRKAGKVQEEYDAMASLSRMLAKDMAHMRSAFPWLEI